MISEERLKEVLSYDPESGEFTWVSNCGNVTPGAKAGSPDRYGYIRIRVDRKMYQAHRLAWLFVEGYLPEHDIDHKNGKFSDNSWKNLRHVSKKCNSQNKAKYVTNTSGFPGVTWAKAYGKWFCRVMIDRKSINLGYYSNLLDAGLARLTFEEQCSEWTCNHRSEIMRAIKSMWPEFRLQQ